MSLMINLLAIGLLNIEDDGEISDEEMQKHLEKIEKSKRRGVTKDNRANPFGIWESDMHKPENVKFLKRMVREGRISKNFLEERDIK